LTIWLYVVNAVCCTVCTPSRLAVTSTHVPLSVAHSLSMALNDWMAYIVLMCR